MAGVKPGRDAAVVWLGATACAAALSACGISWPVILRFTLLVAAFLLAGRVFAPRGLEGSAAVATALTLGMAVAALLWAAALFFGLPPRVSLVALAGLALTGAIRRERRPRVRLAAPVALTALLCGATVAWTQFGNGRFEPDAGLSFANTYAREAMFHCAITQEMRHGLVVHLPAGSSLPYHVGYHVLAALTAEATDASILDVSYRLMPALLAPGAALAAAGFVESWGASASAAAAGALVLFFADDLSWPFGAAGIRNAAPLGSQAWNLLLGTPILYALHHNRGFLLGALVFFVVLTLLGRHLRDGGRHDLAAGSTLAATLVHCKVSYFVIALSAIGVGCVLSSIRRAHVITGRFVKAGLLTCVIASPLALAFALARPGGDATGFAPFPAYIGVASLVRLGIFPDWDTIRATAQSHPWEFTLRWLPLALVLFIVGTLGVRAIGIRELVARVRSGDPSALLATGVVVAALAMGLAFYTPPDRDNIAYFWAPALLVLALLSGIEIIAPSRGIGPSLALIGAAAVLALPGTIQFLWVERSVAIEPLLHVPAGVVEAGNYLAAHAEPGDVLLEPDTSSSMLAALAPVRPVMAWADWLRNSLGKTMIQERIRDVRTFFGDGEPAVRRRVLARYGVRWIWAPRNTEPPPDARRMLENPSGELWRVELKPTGLPRYPDPEP